MKHLIFTLTPSTSYPNITPAFSLFAHPSLRRIFLSPKQAEHYLLIGATAYGKPAGLLVASKNLKDRSSELLSLFVDPSWRKQGIGKSLWIEAKKQLEEQGIDSCRFQYAREERDSFPIDDVLKKFAWPSLEINWIIAESHLRDSQAQTDRYVARAERFYRGFKSFPWAELSTEEEDCLRSKLDEEGWYTHELSPFAFEDRIHLPTSFGLRHKGEVVGWMISHLMSRDVLRYSSMFVRGELQSRGHAIYLFILALKKQLECDIPIASLQMRAENQRMIHFISRKIKAYLRGYYFAGTSTCQWR